MPVVGVAFKSSAPRIFFSFFFQQKAPTPTEEFARSPTWSLGWKEREREKPFSVCAKKETQKKKKKKRGTNVQVKKTRPPSAHTPRPLRPPSHPFFQSKDLWDCCIAMAARKQVHLLSVDRMPSDTAASSQAICARSREPPSPSVPERWSTTTGRGPPAPARVRGTRVASGGLSVCV